MHLQQRKGVSNTGGFVFFKKERSNAPQPARLEFETETISYLDSGRCPCQQGLPLFSLYFPFPPPSQERYGIKRLSFRRYPPSLRHPGSRFGEQDPTGRTRFDFPSPFGPLVFFCLTDDVMTSVTTNTPSMILRRRPLNERINLFPLQLDVGDERRDLFHERNDSTRDSAYSTRGALKNCLGNWSFRTTAPSGSEGQPSHI